MDVRIEAESQAEFDAKREDLIKALRGTLGKPPLVPRRGTYPYQNVLLKRLNDSMRSHLEQAKQEIDVILRRSS